MVDALVAMRETQKVDPLEKLRVEMMVVRWVE